MKLFEASLKSSGYEANNGKFKKIVFGTVEIVFVESDDNSQDSDFDDDWFVYLNDRPFSETMEAVFENEKDFFNSYRKRKLKKDKSGNLGMVMAALGNAADNKLYLYPDDNKIFVDDFLELDSDINDYPSLIEHLLAGSGFGTFFSFSEGYYVYLYLCKKAGWSAEKTHKTLNELVGTAPFLTEYMSKKNIEMVDKQFIELFSSLVR